MWECLHAEYDNASMQTWACIHTDAGKALWTCSHVKISQVAMIYLDVENYWCDHAFKHMGAGFHADVAMP